MDTPANYNNYVAIVNEQHDITPDLIAQIKKDFGTLLQTEPDFTTSPAIYISLFNWISPIIENLYKNDRQRFTSLIYTIDAGYTKNKFGKRNESELEQWIHAILLRECLKVFIRKNYKV